MDPEPEAFVPLLPQIDLTDPAATRPLAGARHTAMAIEDRSVPAASPVRAYPHQAQGAAWRHSSARPS